MLKRLLLYLLEKIPYRSKWGLSLADLLKEYCYRRLWWHDKCICGGRIHCYGTGFEDGYVVECGKCGYCYDED